MFQFINKSKNWVVTIVLAIIIGLTVPSLIALASSVIGDNVVITNPTEQLRLEYDATNYSTFFVDSSNNLNIVNATSTGYPFGIRFINNPDLVSEIPGGIVMGSSYNSIDADSPGSVISGGGFGGSDGEAYKNYISKNSIANIGGGHGNQITSTTTNGNQNSVIGGGGNNIIFNTNNGTIGGGNQNYIAGSFYSGITGGLMNKIDAYNFGTSLYSYIGGGGGNSVGGVASSILGGFANGVYGDYSVILGGSMNALGVANGGAPDYAVILGGDSNTLATSSNYSMAGGRKASITHAGSFLWADSNNKTFSSAATNETAFRSTGGVRFVTAIDVNGNPTKTTSINSSGDFTLPGKLIVSASSTPVTSTSTCSAGTISWDTGYIYVCISTNTWKRLGISTW